MKMIDLLTAEIKARKVVEAAFEKLMEDMFPQEVKNGEAQETNRDVPANNVPQQG
jgi:hypothetical protein